MSPPPLSLPSMLLNLRAARGHSQQDTADALTRAMGEGYSCSSKLVSAMECGARHPTVTTLEAYARAYNADGSVLLRLGATQRTSGEGAA